MKLVKDRRPVVVAAIETPPRAEGAPTTPIPGRRFHAVLAVEGVWTGDGRYFEPGCFTWRDLPLPLMATDKSTHGPGPVEPSVTIGSIDRMERIGAEVHIWGAYVTSTDPEVNRLIALIDDGHLRGISLDGDDSESEIILPSEMMDEPVVDEDGNLHFANVFPREVYSHVRIMGGTVVPFPAIPEAFIESIDDDGKPVAAPAPLAIAAAALGLMRGVTGWVYQQPAPAVTASAALDEYPVQAPVMPASEWFDDLVLDGPTAWTVTNHGEVYGHLALWDQCHLGSPPGECITPPPSPSGYEHFHMGEIVCADGSRARCGVITMTTGHAELALGLQSARAHYDHTGTVVAHVRMGEDEWGIWVHGALMPGLTPIQLRTLMGADLSGDWRADPRGRLELVAALAVNVPGFPKVAAGRSRPRAYCRRESGMVASLVASLSPTGDEKPRRNLDDPTTAALVERIAASIGRSRPDRIAQLRSRVHGGK